MPGQWSMRANAIGADDIHATHVKDLARKFVITLLVLFALGIGALYWATHTPPAWYDPPSRDNERVEHVADRFEYRVVEEAQKIRADDATWTVRVREEHLNAWLATRLPQWLAHTHDLAWPAYLHTPQVHLQAEGVSLAVGLGQSDRRIVMARFMPGIEAGRLRVDVHDLTMGRLPLPGDPTRQLLEQLREARRAADQAPQTNQVDDDNIMSVIERLIAGHASVEPVFTLSDGRRVRLLALEIHDGAIDMTSQTLANNDS